MNDEYEEYESLCELRREENEKYLDIFEESLEQSGLSEKTIRKHISNVYFYLDTYLLREDANPMKEGCYLISGFLGDFFIRKCMWSTPATITSTATSIKKFYKCMYEHGHVEKLDYETLVTIIKDEKQFWIEDCEAYNDIDLDNPFAPF